MFTTAIAGEKLLKTLENGKVTFELVHVPATIWCGVMGYAPNLTDEPDIDGLLKKYQNLCKLQKFDLANPNWSNCISVDYWQNGAVPRGMVFSQQVLTEKQNIEYDVYKMPESLYIRIACTYETAKAAFGREEAGVWEFFGLIKDQMDGFGYETGTNGAQEIEMYGPDCAYAYVQVQEKSK